MAEDKFEQAVIDKLKSESWHYHEWHFVYGHSLNWFECRDTSVRRWCQDYGQVFSAPRGAGLRKFFKTRISA